MASSSSEPCSAKIRLVTSPEGEISRFLALDIPLPEEINEEIPDAALCQLVDSVCSQCKHKRKLLPPSDAYPHLYSNNSPLLEAEEEVVNDHFLDGNEELLAIDTLLSAIAGQARRLKEHAAYVRDCVSQYQCLLAPVRRLPAELLIEIALFTLPEDNSERDSLNVKSGVWKLTRVCSSWRKTILNSSRLWSDINVNILWPHHAVSILEEIIKRSQSAPLDVRFFDRENEHSVPLLKILCSQSDRWRSAEFYIHPSHWPIFDRIRNKLGQLRSLQLGIRDVRRRFKKVSWNDPFSSAPHLHTVALGPPDSLRGIYRPPPIEGCLQFPKESIEKFFVCLTDDLYPHIHNIIPPRIVQLSIDAWSYNAPEIEVALAPVSYPSIRQLQIYTVYWFLGAFTCPGLESLTLNTLRVEKEFFNYLEPFLNRSIHKPRSFGLHLCSITSPVTILPQIYKTLHFTTRLTLSASCEADRRQSRNIRGYFKLLQLTSNRSLDYLPGLSTLTIKFDDFNPSSPLCRLIHTVVASRVNPPAGYTGAKLSKFTFTDSVSKRSGKDVTLDTYGELLERKTAPWECLYVTDIDSSDDDD